MAAKAAAVARPVLKILFDITLLLSARLPMTGECIDEPEGSRSFAVIFRSSWLPAPFAAVGSVVAPPRRPARSDACDAQIENPAPAPTNKADDRGSRRPSPLRRSAAAPMPLRA